MSATAPKQIIKPVAWAPLAATGVFTLVTEYKRKLRGYPPWKQLIFDVTRYWLRFCNVRLGLPTIIHHDRQGDFTSDICGGFDSRDLAFAAIEAMKQERLENGQSDSQFIWYDGIPRNGVTPERSGNYVDNGVVGNGSPVFDRANKIVHCPFNGSLCNPDETAPRATLNTIVRRSQEANEAARNLKQLIT